MAVTSVGKFVGAWSMSFANTVFSFAEAFFRYSAIFVSPLNIIYIQTYEQILVSIKILCC